MPLSQKAVIRILPHQVVAIASGLLKHSLEIAKDVRGLRFDVTNPDRVTSLIEGPLAAYEQKVANLPAMGKGRRLAPAPMVGGHEASPVAADGRPGVDQNKCAFLLQP